MTRTQTAGNFYFSLRTVRARDEKVIGRERLAQNLVSVFFPFKGSFSVPVTLSHKRLLRNLNLTVNYSPKTRQLSKIISSSI